MAKVINLFDRKSVKFKKENIETPESIVTYEIFEGYDDVQKLLAMMKKKNFPGICGYKVIKFNDMFYAVTMENYGRKLVIGKSNMWYVTDVKFEHKRENTIKLTEKFKYPMNEFRPYDVRSLGIIRDLHKMDENLRQYDVFPDRKSLSGFNISKSTDMHNCYINALGLAFVSPRFFVLRESIHLLKDYFMMEYLLSYETLFSEKYFKCFEQRPIGCHPLQVHAINPFYSTVIISSDAFDVEYKMKAFFYGFTDNNLHTARMNPYDITINLFYNSDIKDVEELKRMLSSLK